MLTGINFAAQSVGALLFAPLAKRFPTRSVLASAVLVFGLVSALHLIVDAATGGVMKQNTIDKVDHYGHYNANWLFAIYTVSGMAYGMVELIRRIVPVDIVGGDLVRLRKVNAIVHILYEIAGMIGAFTSVPLVNKFGYNYSSFLSPACFVIACLAWSSICSLGHSRTTERALARRNGVLPQIEAAQKRNYFAQVGDTCLGFVKTCGVGAYYCCTSRKFIWLVPGYAVALYAHRFLENVLAPIWAHTMVRNSSYSQILVGGSNVGELLGAITIILLGESVPTPLPWLRLDALLLLLIWAMPYIPHTVFEERSAWAAAALFAPISYAWATGDVSLSSYIQSTFARHQPREDSISMLGAVMAFLYVSYIVLYSFLSYLLGRWVDSQVTGKRDEVKWAAGRFSLKFVAGVHFTVIAAVIFAATFVPRGALAFNPRQINDDKAFEEEEDEGSFDQPSSDCEVQAADASAKKPKRSDLAVRFAQPESPQDAAKLEVAASIDHSSGGHGKELSIAELPWLTGLKRTASDDTLFDNVLEEKEGRPTHARTASVDTVSSSSQRQHIRHLQPSRFSTEN